MLHPVRKMVRELAEKLHFTGIYFHELFHDDMEIYVKDRDRRPHYSFYRMDQLFDFIAECDLIPFVELSFVPFLMVENLNKDALMRNSISDMRRICSNGIGWYIMWWNIWWNGMAAVRY